ncbi:3-dehydroquinate synthase family protein [Nonomuraea sp. NPDC026600]|uniref:3-dehydroquinate synthase n=1 Tax=Nonomuraea sp. NPDC026600 TaxID=3155363 RepID=UPI0033F2C7F2
MIPADVHLVRDRIPLPEPGCPIEGLATRTDSYPVLVSADAETTAHHLKTFTSNSRVVIVTDETVAGLHGESLVEALTRQGMDVATLTIPPGERSKAIATAIHLLDRLAHSSVGRRDLLVAFGGGVVIDTAGWVASAYMRGIPYANVPTTLLAAVDAAIGGKVAVDHAVAKNLIGAFYQPVGVVTNVAYLATLDARQIRAGLAEVIKKGMIASPELFSFIERELEAILGNKLWALERLVQYASATKCELIARDPYEQDLRCRRTGSSAEPGTGKRAELNGVSAVSAGW